MPDLRYLLIGSGVVIGQASEFACQRRLPILAALLFYQSQKSIWYINRFATLASKGKPKFSRSVNRFVYQANSACEHNSVGEAPKG